MALRFPATIDDVKQHRTDSLDRFLAAPKRPLVFDVLATAEDPEMVVTNVPRTVVFRERVEYSFGTLGAGASELAANILNLYVPPSCDPTPRCPVVEGVMGGGAIQCVNDFAAAFLTRPGSQLHISASEALDFLLKRGYEISRGAVREIARATA